MSCGVVVGMKKGWNKPNLLQRAIWTGSISLFPWDSKGNSHAKHKFDNFSCMYNARATCSVRNFYSWYFWAACRCFSGKNLPPDTFARNPLAGRPAMNWSEAPLSETEKGGSFPVKLILQYVCTGISSAAGGPLLCDHSRDTHGRSHDEVESKRSRSRYIPDCFLWPTVCLANEVVATTRIEGKLTKPWGLQWNQLLDYSCTSGKTQAMLYTCATKPVPALLLQ